MKTEFFYSGNERKARDWQRDMSNAYHPERLLGVLAATPQAWQVVRNFQCQPLARREVLEFVARRRRHCRESLLANAQRPYHWQGPGHVVRR